LTDFMNAIGNIVRNNRGVALLITLSIISILVVTTLELNKKTRTSVYFSATGRDKVTLNHMALSGVHAAMALLVKDKENSDIDSVQEDWANPEKLSGLVNDIPFEEGAVNVTIIDELGKIQVNALVNFPESRQFNEAQREMWDHFLNLVISPLDRTEDTAPTPIINALKDWLDYGDNDATTGLSGAESDYYQDLDPPYSCRNGPITHLGELPMIKGITPEFFQGVGGVPGIDAYMTVYGMTEAEDHRFTFKGAININTADLPVIAAILPAENELLAQSIFEYRTAMSDETYTNDLSRPAWYKDAPGCSDVEIDPKLITLSSDVFQIHSEASFRDMKMTIAAIVTRLKDKETGKWYAKLLSWEEK
jgi:general secretion pathway protein K